MIRFLRVTRLALLNSATVNFSFIRLINPSNSDSTIRLTRSRLARYRTVLIARWINALAAALPLTREVAAHRYDTKITYLNVRLTPGIRVTVIVAMPLAVVA